jgi:peptidoglycan hydrolase-like protein with peptidoglycan-binding domain
MNTKPIIKIVAFAIIVFCVAPTFFVNASTESQSSNVPASVYSALQSSLASLYAMIAGIVIPPSPSSSPVSTTSSVPSATASAGVAIFKLGNNSVMVTIIQSKLIEDGYLKPPATGIFDPNTQAAVEAIQKADGLPVTGYVTLTTSSIATLFKEDAPAFTPIGAGTTGAKATAIQKILIKFGDLNIPTTTAYFGAKTTTAVKKFQKSHGLLQTGTVGPATFAAMNNQ